MGGGRTGKVELLGKDVGSRVTWSRAKWGGVTSR